MSNLALGPVALLLAAALAGCTSSGLPALSAAPPQSEAAPARPGPGAVETAVIVKGTATGVYTQVARAALNCWFGAEGPLRTTHVFHAEAAPPTSGGAAEIVIHERDMTLGDQRGTRAFRVGFENVSEGVRVLIAPLKLETAQAELMRADVETWVRNGQGCQTRTLSVNHSAELGGKAPARKQR